MESLVIVLFAAVLIGCVILNINLVIAMVIGYVIFASYTKIKGFSFREIGQMSLSGILTVKNILITFLLIGSLTALWRASGCIASIVCYVSGLIQPSIFIMVTFLLCMIVSILTGTSFGTAATMGVICMSIAKSMNMSVFWIGGAVLSGVFWGDRCSPVSTSALLVSTITDTDLYGNIRNMIRTAIVPTILTCLIYLVVGFWLPGKGAMLDVTSLFTQEFDIQPVCLIPAALILVLAICKVNVKTAMGVSILSALIVAFFVQKMSFLLLLKTMITGYEAATPSLASMTNGGGITSMLRVGFIVCIASCYSGIFEATGMLDPMQGKIEWIAKRCGVFPAMVLISVPVSAVACNQTLSIMLTQQLTSKLNSEREKIALYLEDSVVLIAGLIPWSIAGSVPLTTVGASNASMAAGVFLFILPLWNILMNTFTKKKIR